MVGRAGRAGQAASGESFLLGRGAPGAAQGASLFFYCAYHGCLIGSACLRIPGQQVYLVGDMALAVGSMDATPSIHACSRPQLEYDVHMYFFILCHWWFRLNNCGIDPLTRKLMCAKRASSRLRSHECGIRAGEWKAIAELLHAPLPVLRSGMLAPTSAAPPAGAAQSAPAALDRAAGLSPSPADAASSGAAAGTSALSALSSVTTGSAAVFFSTTAALTARAADTSKAGLERGGAGALGEHLEGLLLEAVASGCASSAKDIMALLGCTLAWHQVCACNRLRRESPSCVQWIDCALYMHIYYYFLLIGEAASAVFLRCRAQSSKKILDGRRKEKWTSRRA